jgi:hypothetical protein
MTEADAYATGQRDELEGKPAQRFRSRAINDAYAFGRLVASGLTIMARNRIAPPTEAER